MERRKVPFAAVVLIPPAEIWEPIQAVRRRHDPAVDRWMPHVTLLYPFLSAEELPRAADELGEMCASSLGFGVDLARFDCFVHGHRWATVWLRPEPPEPIIRLQSQLLECFPWCDDTQRFPNGFTPHLSVGRWPAGRSEAAVAELQECWQQLNWHVDRVCLIARPDSGEAPFSVRHELPLGGRNAATGP